MVFIMSRQQDKKDKWFSKWFCFVMVLVFFAISELSPMLFHCIYLVYVTILILVIIGRLAYSENKKRSNKN